jgi:hypothetical protein
MFFRTNSEDGFGSPDELKDSSGETPAQTQPVLAGYSGPSSESTQASKSRVHDVILAALHGSLPRGRELRPWEPDKLNARHIAMVCDRANGLTGKEIALKYRMSEAWVSVVLTHPDSIVMLGALMSLNADKQTDINARLQGYAHEMLQGKVDIFRTTKDNRLKDSIATDILDRAGYGARQKLDVDSTHRFVVPASAALAMSNALSESQRVATVDYTQHTGRKLGQPALESGVQGSTPGFAQELEQLEVAVSASPDASPAHSVELKLALEEEKESQTRHRRSA